ncbi:MAG: ATP-binding cassette domain-containing protein [Candidatus Kapaibacterium sp.]|nr:ATP-binding cassette domain-containing protein [Bacteroidota bacterium]
MDKDISAQSFITLSTSLQCLYKALNISVSTSDILALIKEQSHQSQFETVCTILQGYGVSVRTFAGIAQVDKPIVVYTVWNNTVVAIDIRTKTAHEVCTDTAIPISDIEMLPVFSIKGNMHSFLTNEKNMPEIRNNHQQEEHHHHVSTGHILDKLWQLLKQEKKDIVVVIVYSVIMGLLSLIVPLSSQAIVNAVSLGIYTSQLVVLCVGVGLGLLLLGVFNVMEMYVVDVLRRRIFVRTAFDIAYRLPRIKHRALEGEYAPELVNRFFDVITVTKSLGKFLLDGVSAVLVALIGLILLAVYHPFFLLFDIFLVVFIVVLVLVLGRKGLTTSIMESKKKYAVANWLEEIARCQQAFKLNATPEFSYEYLDSIAEKYVKAHRSHFLVIARQVAGSSFFRSIATVGVLGLGGMLVIERQLSLGQLVAAELVIIALLGSIEKLITQFEDFYDLLTGIDKLATITDKELEAVGGESPDISQKALDIKILNLQFTYPNNHTVFNGLTLHIPSGNRVSLVGENGSGKTTLAELLAGIHEPKHGAIFLNDYDTRRMSLTAIRNNIGVVSRDNDVFAGTIEQNITMGRVVSYKQLTWAIAMAGLEDDMRTLPNGLNTYVVSGGTNLPYGVVRRIILARCILCKPRLIILDEAFEGVERATKLAIIEQLYNESHWTILDISHDGDLLRKAHEVCTLKDGNIIEHDAPEKLMMSPNSELRKLFPDLCR